MLIWLCILILLGAGAAFAAAPFLRNMSSPADDGARKRIFQQQIADIDREEQNGVIDTTEAGALRIEAQRGLLASSAPSDKQEVVVPKPQTTIALATIAMVIGGAVMLYAVKGRPDVASSPTRAHPVIARAETNTASQSSPAVGSVDGMVNQLAKRLEQNPDDPEGWRMLGWSYFNLNRHKEAADAYARAVDLAPENAAYQAAYGEALVMSSGGFVTDEAKQVFQRTAELEKDNPRARFFLGLAKDQSGDTTGAIADWIDMVNTAPPGADWVPDLRKRIADRSSEAGIDITGKLKDPEASATSAPRGPTIADVQAAMEMPAGDRQTMIDGMVAGLAARLQENPDDPDGWVRLIRSRMVLGQPAQAKADLASALDAFSGDSAVSARILAEARALGVEAD